MSRGGAAVGPLGRVVTHVGVQLSVRGRPVGAGANPLVLLHRAAFLTRGELDKDALGCLLRWSEEHDLGQEAALVRAAAARRERALAALAATGPRRVRLRHRRLRVTPQWRLAVGLGNRLNPHEIGLSLHGTYGLPIIPGSTCKGVTCAWATEIGVDEDEPELFAAVFGGPGGRGQVTFLDALPVAPVRVTRDVVTPHVQPYYQGRAAPGEHHNPIPSEFLAVSGGAFAVDLVGPDDLVGPAARWCREALDELGVGGKTSAGYGYLGAQSAESPS